MCEYVLTIFHSYVYFVKMELLTIPLMPILYMLLILEAPVDKCVKI